MHAPKQQPDMGLFDFFRSRSSSLRGRKSTPSAAAADLPPPPASAAPRTTAAASSSATSAAGKPPAVPLPPASAPAALDSLATTASSASSTGASNNNRDSNSNNNNDDDDCSDSDSDLDDDGFKRAAPAAAAPAAESLGSIQNYEIVKELGRGATAVVQLGKQKDGEQLVALKVFKTSLLKKMREVKRVGRRMVVSTALDKVQVEIAIMKKLQHRNLLNLLEVFDDDSDTLVLMLEYAPHGQVMHWDAAARAYVRSPSLPPLDERALRACARELLLGLEYLHENNICHRDLKPENILVAGDGAHKIADFGVAHFFDDETSEKNQNQNDAASGPAKRGFVSSTAGTYAFMAPETLKGGAYDAYAADVWALGVTLHALALGRIPFYDPDVVALFEQIEHTPVVLPVADEDAENNQNENQNAAPRTAVSRALADFMYGMLEKDPEKRWSLKQCKQHAWVLEGLDESAKRAFLDAQHEVVSVNSEDVANAVTKVSSFNVLLRVKLGANRWLRKAMQSSGERKRASLTADDVSRSSIGGSMSSVDEGSSAKGDAKPEAGETELKAPLADNQAEI